MSDLTEAAQTDQGVHLAGAITVIAGMISGIGVLLFIAMYIFFAAKNNEMGMRVGMINDISVALQYLLTIPAALALYPILREDNPVLMHVVTIIGIVSMLIVTALQFLLVFKVLTFEQQLPWVAIAIIFGVGSWLVITGLMARTTGRLPNSLLISALAVPYFGYPVWAIWLGLHLVNW